ncbi:MAG: S8 family serine peptidase [Acidimicrobiia bacterium]
MLRRCAVVLLALPLVAAGIATQVRTSEAGLLSSRYIVVLEDGADPAAVARDVSGLGATVQGLLGAVDGLVAALPRGAAAAVETRPGVRFVTPDRPMRLADSTTSHGVSRIGAATDTGVEAVPVPSAGNRAGVAILDTGIADHPDLNVAGGVNCSSDLLGNLVGGLIGVGDGYSDPHGHGTHVAGTVAALADGNGAVGVSPGAPLYAVKVFGALGTGKLSDVICGLDWVAANAAEKNIKVVNMSLGGNGLDDTSCGADAEDALHVAVCNVVAQGVTVVVAAGNAKVNLGETVPASYDEVLTVGAMADYDGLPGGTAQPTCGDSKDPDDTVAGFSNYADVDHDADHMISAPGVCIFSTWNDGSYATISGTSMASPHAAGAVARCIDAGPCAGLAPGQIIQKLRADAAARPLETGFFGDPNAPLDDERYYGHLVDASRY